jgi:hypothetical protein
MRSPNDEPSARVDMIDRILINEIRGDSWFNNMLHQIFLDFVIRDPFVMLSRDQNRVDSLRDHTAIGTALVPGRGGECLSLRNHRPVGTPFVPGGNVKIRG